MKLTSRYFETLLCALYNNGANAFGSIKNIDHLAVNTATLLKNKKDKEKYANYLVVPNNCLTHTHTHTHTHTPIVIL